MPSQASTAPRCCARLLRRAYLPPPVWREHQPCAALAVRRTQFGAGDMVVEMDIRLCKQDTDSRLAVPGSRRPQRPGDQTEAADQEDKHEHRIEQAGGAKIDLQMRQDTDKNDHGSSTRQEPAS